ncbi:MAG: DUF4810 domain-containing protein [Opitutae bacterium]|nr:DUF4810 domain-containing protein [Opitutae bacterium]
MKRLLLLAGCLFALAGCQTQRSLYYWGNYETTNYLAYSKPEKVPLETQREKLAEDLEKAKGSTLAVHPGLHAQLGYVCYQLGRLDEAIREFTAEKTLFPESVAFMDRMIEKAKGVASK